MRLFICILTAVFAGCSNAETPGEDPQINEPQKSIVQDPQVKGNGTPGDFRQAWFADAFQFCNGWLEDGLQIDSESQRELTAVAIEDHPPYLADFPIFAGAATNAKIYKDYGYIESSRSIVKRPEGFSNIFKRHRNSAVPEFVALEDDLCAVTVPYGEGEERIPDNNNYVWDWNAENRKFRGFEQAFFQTNRDFENLRLHKSRYRLEKAWGGSVFGFFMSAEHDSSERVSIFYVTSRPKSRRPFSVVYFATYPNTIN